MRYTENILLLRMRYNTGNSVVDRAIAHYLKYCGIIKLLRNRIDNSQVNLTLV